MTQGGCQGDVVEYQQCKITLCQKSKINDNTRIISLHDDLNRVPANNARILFAIFFMLLYCIFSNFISGS